MTVGIIPAAGVGSRIQPLAFSKELLPVGSRSGRALAQPRAVSEYIVERMIAGGASTICFVISPKKHDILQHHGAGTGGVRFLYAVQGEPDGLCDAVFSALPVVRHDEPVLVGLPDTVWFPADGLTALPDDELGFLLFPVENPSVFDAVLTDAAGRVREIRVKSETPGTNWVWGAFKIPGAVFHELWRLWLRRGRRDAYIGSLVNAHLGEGGRAVGVHAGQDYVDVGTFDGYRRAIELLRARGEDTGGPAAPDPLFAPGGEAREPITTKAGD